ncbi:MAG: hypothetical protein VKM92_00320 [Cyanobacteriota bacterium]|nr:hypothetical protein [Cyanobacteriota bacterium]
MSATSIASSTPAISSPKLPMTFSDSLMLSSALRFQPEQQVGSFAWDGSLKPSTASPGSCTKYIRRDTWVLKRNSDDLYLVGIQGKTLQWAAQPELAWSCLSPQRAAQVVADFRALFGELGDYRLVPLRLWCRADEYPKGWFCDE